MDGRRKSCVDYAVRMHVQERRNGWLVAFHILFLPPRWGAGARVMHEPHASSRSNSGLTCRHSNFATVHRHVATTQLLTGFSIYMPSYMLTVCGVNTGPLTPAALPLTEPYKETTLWRCQLGPGIYYRGQLGASLLALCTLCDRREFEIEPVKSLFAVSLVTKSSLPFRHTSLLVPCYSWAFHVFCHRSCPGLPRR